MLNSKDYLSQQSVSKKDELKTVIDKVKYFFGDVTAGAKESFAQITGSAVSKGEEEAEANTSSTPRDERSSASRSRASVSTLRLLH